MATRVLQFRRQASVLLAVVSVALALGPTRALAESKPVAPCITPTNVDLNDRYDVSAAIVAFFCTSVEAGRYWTVSNAWFMSPVFEPGAGVPEGFDPGGATPLEDYIAKFAGIKYVVDPGTKKEKTFFFANSEELRTLTDGGFDIANPLALGVLRPQSVGTHVVESYVVFDETHCDGFAGSAEDHCLPAGETLYSIVEFTVSPGHN